MNKDYDSDDNEEDGILGYIDAIIEHREQSGFNELNDATLNWIKNQSPSTYFSILIQAFQDGYTIAKNKYKQS